jgi:hypothetical protein
MRLGSTAAHHLRARYALYKRGFGLMLHRFAGETKEGKKFYVQVKQDKRTGRKDFMSVFPASKRQK